MEIAEGYDYLYKIVIVGDSGVGKTNLLTMLTRNEFMKDSNTTIGVEFSTKTFYLKNEIIKAQIWDTAGQERYRAITSAYYRGTVGALIVYDITKRITLKNSINHWLKQLRDYSPDDLIIMLIGNKSDLEQREVLTSQGEMKAKENNLLFLETSALTGHNVNKAFEKLIKIIYDQQRSKNTEVLKVVPEKLTKKTKKLKPKKKKGCC